ncbi:glycoside hydrolase family 15 [Cellulomonas hominis]
MGRKARGQRWRRRHWWALGGVTAAVTVTAALVVALVEPAPGLATTGLYAEGVALASDGSVVTLAAGTTAVLHPGTRVIDDGTPASAALADAQRAWLASGTVPGTDGPYGDLVRTALLDIHTLVLADGAAVAGWSERWRYVWPRDASFVAVALARTGHVDDALEILHFLAGVQDADGTFEARYLPDGSGPPDDRGTQTDGTGWVLWAAAEVADAIEDPAARQAAVTDLRGLVDRSADRAVALVAGDGLPPASPDYWEVAERKLTLGTVAPLLAGLSGAAELYAVVGDDDARADVTAAAARTRRAVEETFGPGGYARYADGDEVDAATAFLLPPFQPQPLPGALAAWRASATALARPAGGLAPGAGWKQDGVSWTPQTSLYALAAASVGDTADAEARLTWLARHRTSTGAIPEKVLADGSPAAVAPLTWSDAFVVLAVAALAGP